MALRGIRFLRSYRVYYYAVSVRQRFRQTAPVIASV